MAIAWRISPESEKGTDRRARLRASPSDSLHGVEEDDEAELLDIFGWLGEAPFDGGELRAPVRVSGWGKKNERERGKTESRQQGLRGRLYTRREPSLRRIGAWARHGGAHACHLRLQEEDD